MRLKEKLVHERHQHFTALEQRPAYIRGWGQGYRDHEAQIKTLWLPLKKIVVIGARVSGEVETYTGVHRDIMM